MKKITIIFLIFTLLSGKSFAQLTKAKAEEYKLIFKKTLAVGLLEEDQDYVKKTSEKQKRKRQART